MRKTTLREVLGRLLPKTPYSSMREWFEAANIPPGNLTAFGSRTAANLLPQDKGRIKALSDAGGFSRSDPFYRGLGTPASNIRSMKKVVRPKTYAKRQEAPKARPEPNFVWEDPKPEVKPAAKAVAAPSTPKFSIATAATSYPANGKLVVTLMVTPKEMLEILAVLENTTVDSPRSVGIPAAFVESKEETTVSPKDSDDSTTSARAVRALGIHARGPTIVLTKEIMDHLEATADELNLSKIAWSKMADYGDNRLSGLIKKGRQAVREKKPLNVRFGVFARFARAIGQPEDVFMSDAQPQIVLPAEIKATIPPDSQVQTNVHPCSFCTVPCAHGGPRHHSLKHNCPHGKVCLGGLHVFQNGISQPSCLLCSKAKKDRIAQAKSTRSEDETA